MVKLLMSALLGGSTAIHQQQVGCRAVHSSVPPLLVPALHCAGTHRYQHWRLRLNTIQFRWAHDQQDLSEQASAPISVPTRTSTTFGACTTVPTLLNTSHSLLPARTATCECWHSPTEHASPLPESCGAACSDKRVPGTCVRACTCAHARANPCMRARVRTSSHRGT